MRDTLKSSHNRFFSTNHFFAIEDASDEFLQRVNVFKLNKSAVGKGPEHGVYTYAGVNIWQASYRYYHLLPEDSFTPLFYGPCDF